MSGNRIAEFEKQIAELKQCWPVHSVPPAMMERLDELETELQKEQMQENRPDGRSQNDAQPLYLQAIGHVENEFIEPNTPDLIHSVESRIIF